MVSVLFPFVLLWIPSAAHASGYDAARFDAMTMRAQRVLAPSVARKAVGMGLVIKGDWRSESKAGGGAGARRADKVITLTLNGALARASAVTQETVVFAMCHELGHMVAAFPRIENEIESDVFAAAECMPLPACYATLVRGRRWSRLH